MLVFVGRQLEPLLGAAAFALLLLAGVYAGAAAEVAFAPDGPRLVIGASAAVSAAIAAFAFIFNRNQVRAIGPFPPVVVRALWLGAAWLGLQLAMGVAGGGFGRIAIWSHVGGFAAGLLLTRPLLLWRYGRVRR